MIFYQRRYWENISILYQYYHSMIWDCYVKGNLITWKFRYPKKKKSYTNCQTRYMYSFFPFQFCTWVWFGRNVVTFFCHLLVRYIHVDLLTTWTSVSCKKKNMWLKIPSTCQHHFLTSCKKDQQNYLTSQFKFLTNQHINDWYLTSGWLKYATISGMRYIMSQWSRTKYRSCLLLDCKYAAKY